MSYARIHSKPHQDLDDDDDEDEGKHNTIKYKNKGSSLEISFLAQRNQSLIQQKTYNISTDYYAHNPYEEPESPACLKFNIILILAQLSPHNHRTKRSTNGTVTSPIQKKPKS